MDPKLASPISTPPHHPSTPFTNSHNFTLLVTAIVVGLSSALILLSLYIIKCYANYQRIDRLRRFSFSRRGSRIDSLEPNSPHIFNRGLARSVVQSIPTFHYKKIAKGNGNDSCECAICLNEFEEGDKLRLTPNCGHAFHIDCIDIWLLNNVNCPLCRNPISASTIIASERNGEDFVAIELDGIIASEFVSNQERLNSDRDLSSTIVSISPSPVSRRSTKRLRHFTSIGDECIIDNLRRKDDDEQFAVQPIRRSFSVDSAANGQIYLAIQKMVQQQKRRNEIISSECGSSSSSRVNKKSFFSFGYLRGSKTSAQIGSYGRDLE